MHCELIKAWTGGARIEVNTHHGWEIVEKPSWFIDAVYRIKPERKRYRVAKFDFGPKVAANEDRAMRLEEITGFKGWLTDWIEYD